MGGMPQPGNSITCTRVLPVRAQRCPPAVGLVWRTLPNPMSMRDHPGPRHRDPRNTHACATPSRTVGEAAKPRPAPPSTPLSPNCRATPSPRTRSKSPSPSRPSSKPAPPKPTRCAATHVDLARHHADLAHRRYLHRCAGILCRGTGRGGRYLAETGGPGAGMPVGNCPGRRRVDRAVRNPRVAQRIRGKREQTRTDGGQGTQRSAGQRMASPESTWTTYGSASWLPRGS